MYIRVKDIEFTLSSPVKTKSLAKSKIANNIIKKFNNCVDISFLITYNIRNITNGKNNNIVPKKV